MNHRPFEDWLLENQSLSAEQKQQLNDHLKFCTPCTALAEVDLVLNSSKPVHPSPGFSGRFQQRLSTGRKIHHQRHIWGLAGLGVITLIAMVILVFALFKFWLDSPAQALVSWVTWWITMFSSLRTYGSIGLVFLKIAAGIIPLPFWLGMAGGSILLVMLWIASLWKLAYSTNVRRLA
jgi:hypothetical protein